MLETHKNDPKGYNLFFVDPIHKGNFASRLSHSCDPNCGTVTTISNGIYIISMYAMKDISFGEELTFDYCSFTEDLNECRKAVCLCGTQNCRGSYLEFSKSKSNLKSLENLLPFLKRQKQILKACTGIALTTEQNSLLESYNIRGNILKNSPLWLKIWISMVLEFIDKEKSELMSKESADQKVYATNMSENRLQNLVISVDRIKYFLMKAFRKEQSSANPPLKLLNTMEIFELLWGKLREKSFTNPDNSPDSFIEDLLLTLLSSKKDTMKISSIVNLILVANGEIQKQAKTDRKKTIILIRIVLLKLSWELRNLAKELHKHSFSDDRDCHLLALSDILYFKAFTFCYFKATEYPMVTSTPVSVRRCELSNLQTYRENRENTLRNDGGTLYSEEKIYKGGFVWGQMSYWFKQTAYSPELVLLGERRGTLVYPNLSESFKRNRLGYPFLKASKVI